MFYSSVLSTAYHSRYVPFNILAITSVVICEGGTGSIQGVQAQDFLVRPIIMKIFSLSNMDQLHYYLLSRCR